MGFVEPTSPMPAKEGEVIPLPCSPNFYKKEEAPEEKPEPIPEPPQPKEPEIPKPDQTVTAAPTQEDRVQAQIEKVTAAVAELTQRIEKFRGSKRDKEYLYLDEMLTRHLLSLDCVETHGNDKLRMLRKETIKSINRSEIGKAHV